MMTQDLESVALTLIATGRDSCRQQNHPTLTRVVRYARDRADREAQRETPFDTPFGENLNG